MNPSKPLTPEMLVSRLGDHLVERGMITQDHLLAALSFQEEKRRNGEEAPLLGRILVEMGFISQADLDTAVTEQIIQLRAALEENNRELENRVAERTAELEKALKKLSELNQLKSNFVANISHELRTPLTHIKGYLELLITGDLGPSTQEQARALSTMHRAAQRLERLIEDLILFATAEHNQINLRPVVFNMRSLSESALEQFSQVAKERNVNLSVNAPNQLPAVNADADKIFWVIKQLLDNALKFTPSRGQVQIRLENIGNYIRCTIADNGIGISPSQQEEIFEPFHQLDGSSTRRYGGTGLGLSLAKKIIEAHGSSIEVQSQIGKGSQFSFMLKVAKDTP